MASLRAFFLLVLSTFLGHVLGQTWTDCNPLNSTCPADPALGTSFNQTWGVDSSLDEDYWKIEAGPIVTFDDNGALFTIGQHGDAPTISTKFYIFFGKVEVLMKAASGQGIISSIVLLSDDLDEVDWEIMGGNSSFVETNYYGKGNVTQVNSEYFPCDSPQGTFHNYTLVWTSAQLEYHLDGDLVRTLPYGKAVDGGKSIYPQTPSRLKIGSWPAGDPSSPIGVRQWAGGMTDYNDGPFDMYIKSVKVIDGTQNAKSYTYSDHTGSFQSITVEKGTSDAAEKIHAPPPLTLSERWNNLSPTVRIVIIVVIAVVALALFLGFVWYCVHQRRLGKRERVAADEQWDKEQADLQSYKQRLQHSDFSKGKGFVGVVQVRR